MMDKTHKLCRGCNRTLSIDQFYPVRSRGPDAVRPKCSACCVKAVMASRSKRMDAYNMWQRNQHQKIKLNVLTHYSNGLLECACCGEREYAFLTLDHIHGGGNKHRKAMGSFFNVYRQLYKELCKGVRPEGFRVLCLNCNFAEGRGGCPHRLKREAMLQINLLVNSTLVE